MKIKTGIILILLVGVWGCASNKTMGSGENSEVSSVVSDEIKIGQQINSQILQSFQVYTEPGVVSYLNRVTDSLAAHAERKLPYHVTLLYSEKIYATSAPGGFIYLTTGLLYFLDNEAELAAVLAHEIGQLQYRDPRLSRSRKILKSLAKSGSTVGPALGDIGALAALGLAALNAALENSGLTPDARLIKADDQAMPYLVKAGYDPQGYFDVFYRFLNADSKTVPFFYDYYQSHPISQMRMKNIEARFSKLPLEGKTLSVGRERYQEATQGVREIYRTL